MDFGGSQVTLMVIIGPILMLLVMLMLVTRVGCGGYSSSPRRTVEATDRLYEEENRRDQDGI